MVTYSLRTSTDLLTTSELDSLGAGGNFTVVTSGVTNASLSGFVLDTASGPTTGSWVTDGVIVGDTVINTTTGAQAPVFLILSEFGALLTEGDVDGFSTGGHNYEVRRYGPGESKPLFLLDVLKEDVGYRYIFAEEGPGGGAP